MGLVVWRIHILHPGISVYFEFLEYLSPSRPNNLGSSGERESAKGLMACTTELTICARIPEGQFLAGNSL